MVVYKNLCFKNFDVATPLCSTLKPRILISPRLWMCFRSAACSRHDKWLVMVRRSFPQAKPTLQYRAAPNISWHHTKCLSVPYIQARRYKQSPISLNFPSKRDGIRFPRGTRDIFLLRKDHTSCGAHPASYWTINWWVLRRENNKQPGPVLDKWTLPWLRMRGATLPHPTPSCPGQD